MDKNLLIQYTVVGILVIGALAWILIKFIRKCKDSGKGGCSGCTLAEKCKSPRKGGMSDKLP